MTHIKLEASHVLLLIISHVSLLPFPFMIFSIRQHSPKPAWDCTGAALRPSGEGWDGTVRGHCLHWERYWQQEVAERQKESEQACRRQWRTAP